MISPPATASQRPISFSQARYKLSMISYSPPPRGPEPRQEAACPPGSGYLGLTSGLIALSLQRLPGCRGGGDLRLHGVDPVAEGVGAAALAFPSLLRPVGPRPFGVTLDAEAIGGAICGLFSPGMRSVGVLVPGRRG